MKTIAKKLTKSSIRHTACVIIWLTATVFFATSCGKDSEASSENIETERPSLVHQIQQSSRMYSTECHLHKIITFDDTKQLSGTFMNQPFSIDLPFGKRRIAIPIEATVKTYVDFSNFSESNVHHKGNKVEIILPDPQIMLTSTRVNRDEVKSYVPILRSNFSDEELTKIEQSAHEDLIKELPQLDIIETARLNAARILIPMITQMGYKESDITITFRKKFTLEDIRQLIDNTTVEGMRDEG